VTAEIRPEIKGFIEVSALQNAASSIRELNKMDYVNFRCAHEAKALLTFHMSQLPWMQSTN
jgi:hypothetical protein